MAVQGKNAAYQQLRAPQDNISNDVFYWNEDGFRRRQEERIAEKQSFDRQAESKKARQERLEKYTKNLQNYDTRSGSLNEVQGRYLAEVRDRIGEIVVEMESGDLPVERQVKLQTELSNLQKTPENLKAFTDGMTQRDKEIAEAFASGKIKDNEKYQNYRKTFDQGFSNFQLGRDEHGMPTVAYRDIDGDGILDAEGYDQISKGISAFTFDKNFDPNAQAKAVAEGLVVKTNTTDDNFRKNTTKAWDPDAFEIGTVGSIVQKDGSLTEFGNSYMQDLNLEDTVENRQKAIEEFKKIVRGLEPRVETSDFDYGARTSAIRENRLGKDKDTDTPKDFEGVEIDDSTANSLNIDNSKVLSKSGNGIVLESPQDTNGTTYNDAKVLNYTVNKNGEVVMDIEYTDPTKNVTKVGNATAGEDVSTTTKSGETIRKTIKVPDVDAAEFARKKGMSLSDLKKSVQKPVKESKPTESDPLGLGIG